MTCAIELIRSSPGCFLAQQTTVKTLARRLSTWAALAIATLAIAAAPVSAAPISQKVDRAVRNAIAHGEEHQRVIITVAPGYRDTLKQALTKHGDVIKGESSLIESVSVDLHS